MTRPELLSALEAHDGVAARALAAHLSQEERWATLAEAARANGLAVELLVEELDSCGIVKRFVGRSLLDRNAIDDVSQDTLISIAASLPSFTARSSVTTWVHTIAQRRVADHLRRQRATSPLPEHDFGPTQRISSIIATRETVQEAIRQLPERYREPVLMRDMHGVEYQQIADKLGLSLGTVKSQISRGRAMVAAAIGGLE